MNTKSDEQPSLELAIREKLANLWQKTNEEPASASSVDPDVIEAIKQSVNATTKTYRYVLPTQLLAKLVKPSLDCRSVQAGSGLVEAFDARSICHKVIVPFDRANNNVLGGSTEPYLNNPIRIPAILPERRASQKDKIGFDRLIKVLEYAQKQPGSVSTLVMIMLEAIRLRLADVTVIYPAPNRASARATSDVIRHYIDSQTFGLRLQAVAVALLRTLGHRCKLFDEVRSNSVFASDASTGNAADLECIDTNGRIVLAVEVKDRQLTLRAVEDKLPTVREKGIRELLFLVRGGTEQADEQAIGNMIDREFGSGQNIYVIEWDAFLHACLILLAEEGRGELLRQIGLELESAKADITHRRTWAGLLASM